LRGGEIGKHGTLQGGWHKKLGCQKESQEVFLDQDWGRSGQGGYNFYMVRFAGEIPKERSGKGKGLSSYFRRVQKKRRAVYLSQSPGDKTEVKSWRGRQGL